MLSHRKIPYNFFLLSIVLKLFSRQEKMKSQLVGFLILGMFNSENVVVVLHPW